MPRKFRWAAGRTDSQAVDPKPLLRNKRRQAKRHEQTKHTKRQARQFKLANRLTNKRVLRRDLPFCGVDGEGGGVNEHGQQHYKLLRAGEFELFDDGKPLATRRCLDFLCDLPDDRIYVSFHFGYDTTQILRTDLAKEQIRRLFLDDDGRAAEGITSRYVYWEGFGIEYLQGQYLRVCRLSPDNRQVKGSARTIYETSAFFQCKFTKAMAMLGVASAVDIAEMETMKDKRGGFDQMTAEVRAYNERECAWLALAMEKLRELCRQQGVLPRTYNGPGKLASSVLRAQGVLTKLEYQAITPAPVQAMAKHGFYGGRAEVPTVGLIALNHALNAYDKRSAYPAAMLKLPCLRHATWRKASPSQLKRHRGVYIADASFWHPPNAIYCGLPWRSATGGLKWPRKGRGTYWRCELDASRDHLGARITLHGGYTLHVGCDCQPFAFVQTMFDQRRMLKEAGDPAELIWKLVLNSLYGKLAQRKGGGGGFQNHVWAGLITAFTRTALIEVIGQASRQSALGQQVILMTAVDAIYSSEPLDFLPIGSDLGQWGHEEIPALFTMQSGVYWEPVTSRDPGAGEGDKRLVKTRGMPARDLVAAGDEGRIDHSPGIEALWHEWMAEVPWGRTLPRPTPGGRFPVYPIEMGTFTGLRLAHARGKPETAGSWVKEKRVLTFNWLSKRLGTVHRSAYGSDSILTMPWDGHVAEVSSHWEPTPALSDYDKIDDWIAGMPDFVAVPEDLIGV